MVILHYRSLCQELFDISFTDTISLVEPHCQKCAIVDVPSHDYWVQMKSFGYLFDGKVCIYHLMFSIVIVRSILFLIISKSRGGGKRGVGYLLPN